ncbi:SRPBCC domain-containing protein [Ramlibacter humi]|uniref:Polyketide cyclase n=1 Tax=Ramlibacter humi TaxID=2530451 RepID=A0A4Z0BXA4_9BURK|nr:SRPBCC domain-containing protein [Ramlibacter humi]TFZ03883.1 polyketide cyclase [Ramlibacter humi]
MNDEADRTLATGRRIDAPRERIWEAFRDGASLARWWGPAGFTSTFDVFEFRPGGRWLFTLHGPDGTDYPNTSAFTELAEPSRVVIEAMHFRLVVNLREAGGATDLEWRQTFPTVEHRRQVESVCIPSNEQNLDRLEAELARHP